MKKYNKIYSGCTLALASLLLASCGQSPEQQAATDVNVTGQSAVTVDAVAVTGGPTVALSKSDVSVFKGDTFTLDITMSDFAATEGGGVTLRYDAGLVKVDSVTVDSSVWTFKNKPGQINNAEGSVKDLLFSSYQGVASDANVATVVFSSIEAGESVISLSESPANVFASNGEQVEVVFNATTVTSN